MDLPKQPWPDVLTFIMQRQKCMPPHIRGMDHNADEEGTQFACNFLAKETGLEVHLGDLWVRVCDGTEISVGGPFSAPPHYQPGPGKGYMAMGAITQRGAEAMHKYEDILNEQATKAQGSPTVPSGSSA